MTAPSTVSAPSVDDLLPRAREIAAAGSGMPSKRTLMQELRVGKPKVDVILEHLAAEQNQRRQDARRAMRRLASTARRTHPVRPLPARVWVAPEPPPAPQSAPPAPVEEPQLTVVETQPEPTPEATPAPVSGVRSKRAPVWPVLLLCAPAFVAIWSGWVDLGRLTGFGVVHPLPGIADAVALNTAITLPIGLETYAAYALWVWLSGRVPERARRFAKWSAIGSLVVGGAGQVAYHLMVAAGISATPWQITAAVACLPVAVLGMGAALAHLVRAEDQS